MKNENLPRDILSDSVTDAHRQLMKLVNGSGVIGGDQRGDKTKQVYGVTVRINANKIDHPDYKIIGSPNVEQAMYFAKGIIDGNTAMSVALSFDYGYGERLRRENALENVVTGLIISDSSRRGWLPIYTHEDTKDIIGQQSNVPCCVGVDFLIHDGKLNMTVVFRSNDIAIAFPADAVGYMALQHMIARILEVEVGEYTHYIVSAHYRMSDEYSIKRMLETKPKMKYITEQDVMIYGDV